MAIINHGTPRTYELGIDDRSTRTLEPEVVSRPTHFPVSIGFFQKGPLTMQTVVGDSRTRMYGAKSFELRGKWATHATVCSNIINAEGNQQAHIRLKPTDAAPPANVRLSLDVLETDLPVYKRNTDGSYATDTNGAKIDTGKTVKGYRVKWMATYISSTGSDGVGLGTLSAGDQTDGTNQSQRYPIVDVEASSFGSWGNNNAIRIWSPTTASSAPVSSNLLTKEKVYPFRISVLERSTSTSTPTIVNTLSGAQYMELSWKPGSVNTTESEESDIYVGVKFLDSYRDLEPTDGTPPVFGPFGDFHLYESNIAQLHKLFYNAEYAVNDEFSDFTGADDEEWLFNIVGGTTSDNVPYTAFEIVSSGTGSVRLSSSTNIYTTGGTDGTMNETVLAELVEETIALFNDPTSPYTVDKAKYPISTFYDTGYPLATKLKLIDFIGTRKDVWINLATAVAGEPALTADGESARGAALKARLDLYPESDTFGTSVTRGVIFRGSGILIEKGYSKRLPLLIGLAQKNAQYMGAANGIWKGDKAYDKYPNNVFTLFRDVSGTFAPNTVRDNDWVTGMSWLESYDTHSVYMPAARSVYSDDTSILTGCFSMIACVELQKIGEAARRSVSGNQKLTQALLAKAVTTYVTEQTVTNDKFDSRFTIEPSVTFTAADNARGYSWTLTIRVYGPNMPTVQTQIIETYRDADLTTA